MIRLVIFDLDGTLTHTRSGQTFRTHAADWEAVPGRQEAVRALQAHGIGTAIATNQGGVAFGYLPEDELRDEIVLAGRNLGIGEQLIEICFDHPKASLEQYREDSARRKPQPGMLIALMERAMRLPTETVMIGDRPEDEAAARSAGCEYIDSGAFFSTPVERWVAWWRKTTPKQTPGLEPKATASVTIAANARGEWAVRADAQPGTDPALTTDLMHAIEGAASQVWIEHASDERNLLLALQHVPEIAGLLSAWHTSVGGRCEAYGEGVECCVDRLLNAIHRQQGTLP